MPRRRLISLTLLVVVGALAVGVWLLWPADEAATLRESAARVYDGMPLAEVKQLFGRPADHESKRRCYGPDGEDYSPTTRWWQAPRGTMAGVTFDCTDHVQRPVVFAEPPTKFYLIRRWLGL